MEILIQLVPTYLRAWQSGELTLFNQIKLTPVIVHCTYIRRVEWTYRYQSMTVKLDDVIMPRLRMRSTQGRIQRRGHATHYVPYVLIQLRIRDRIC